MNLLHHLRAAMPVLGQPVATGMPHGHLRADVPADPLVQGAEAALQAYTRASDAYTQGVVTPSVALWSVLIAALVVLLEWLLAQRGRRH